MKNFRECETCGSHGHGGRACPVYRLNQQQERRRAQRRRDLSFGLTPELEREIILIRKAWKIAAALGSILLCATSLFAGTITGRLQTATGGAVTNGTLSFRLSQPAVLVGSASLVTSPASCYISSAGNIAGVPDPLVAPVLTANTISGTLPAGTYFVVVTYAGASGESVASPESTVVLSAQGTVIVSAPVKQPSNATGYNVYIGTTSGSETLQASVTGFTQYSQTSALASGSGLPASNSSVCSLAFSDQLIPSGTYYAVNLVNKNGSTVAGFPQTWCTYGGQSGTINVSNGAPTGNCGTNGVFYPTPIFAVPQNNAQQSISGPLSLGTNPFFAGNATLSAVNNILYVDGVKYATITAAAAACPAYTGAAGNSCIIVVPPGVACGEPSQLADHIALFDYRNCAQSQGIRFNLSAAVTGNVRSKWFIQDNYDAGTIGLNPSKSAVSAYINSYVDRPEQTNGTIAAFNGTMNVNSQSADMSSGAVVGIEGSGQAGAANASPRTIADLRGATFNTFIGGNTSATRMVGVYGQKCTNSGSGTVTNCFGGYFELPTAATTINRALHAEGESSFGGTVSAPHVIIDPSGNGGINLNSGAPNLQVAGTTVLGLPTHLLNSAAAPTIAGAGCGGSGASISTNNGTAIFDVNVGTAPTSGGCTVTMPAATTRWNCSVNDYTTISTSVFFQKQTASTTSSITLQNYSDVAVATAPTASDIYHVKCGGE